MKHNQNVSTGTIGTIMMQVTDPATGQATMPASQGTTQQCIFFVPQNTQALVDWLCFNVIKIGAGSVPVTTITGEVFSAVSNASYEVFRTSIDTEVENTVELNPSQPFIVGEKSILSFKAVTTIDNTQVKLRFSLMLIRDVDA